MLEVLQNLQKFRVLPDLLQQSQKFRVLYRQSYRSFCKNRVLCGSRTNTRGYCAGSATEPTQGLGIVLKGVQTSQTHRVPVLSKKSTLDTLYEYPTEHTFAVFLSIRGSRSFIEW